MAGFTIEHYAGPVTYKTENFLAKNRDFVVAEHQALLQASREAFVQSLFPPEPEANGNAVSHVQPSQTERHCQTNEVISK